MRTKTWLCTAALAVAVTLLGACASRMHYDLCDASGRPLDGPWQQQAQQKFGEVDTRLAGHDARLGAHDKALAANDRRMAGFESDLAGVKMDASNALKVQARLVARNNVGTAPKAANPGGSRPPMVVASGSPAADAAKAQLAFERQQAKAIADRKANVASSKRQLEVLKALETAGIEDPTFEVIREDKKDDIQLVTGTYAGGDWTIVVSYILKDGTDAKAWFYRTPTGADVQVIEDEKKATQTSGYATSKGMWNGYGFVYIGVLPGADLNARVKLFAEKLTLNADEGDATKMWFNSAAPQ